MELRAIYIIWSKVFYLVAFKELFWMDKILNGKKYQLVSPLDHSYFWFILMIYLKILNQISNFLQTIPPFSVVFYLNLSALQLNNVLLKIQQWAYQWKIIFNPDPNKKTQEVIFSRKNGTVHKMSKNKKNSMHRQVL